MANKVATLILKLKDHASRGLKRTERGFAKLGKIIGQHKLLFLGIAAGATLLGKKLIGAADSMEQWSISFETMIGHAGRAKDLMEEIKVFAAETPFELPDVVKGAKGLLAFGIETSKVIPTLKNLGDVAAGLGVPMERLILNFGQVKAQAKLTGRELRDFAIAGVPLLGELAKNLNVTEAEIQDMVSRGKIGFKEVEEAFEGMSGEGGRFNDLMKKQMTTFTGVVSNAKDQVFQLSAELGESLLPSAKAIAKAFTKAATAVRDLLNALEQNAEQNTNTGATAQDLLLIHQKDLKAIKETIETYMVLDERHGISLAAQEDLIEMLERRNLLEKTISETMVRAVAEVNAAEAKRLADEAKKNKKKKKDKDKEVTEIKGFWTFLLKGDKKVTETKEEENKQRAKNFESTLNFISSLSTSENKALAAIGKASAISMATIDTFRAANMALASAPPPWSYALMAAVIAAGLANVAKISGVALEEGGIVLPRHGGMQATLGEGGKAEAVIPLDNDEAKEYIGGETIININAGVLVADDEGLTQLAVMIDEKFYELGRNGQRVSA